MTQSVEVYRQRRDGAIAIWRSVPGENFDMGVWQCGTNACAIGWLAIKKYDGWYFTGKNIPANTMYPTYTFKAVANYFGISRDDAFDVFGENGDATPADVANQLLELEYITPDPPSTDDDAWRSLKRFTEHPETVKGDVSREFVEFVLHVHPDQDYSSADAAMLCREAYDLGRQETERAFNHAPLAIDK